MRNPSNTSVYGLLKANFLKAAKFEKPEYIPCRIVISWPVLNTYREKIIELIKKFPLAFPDYDPNTIKFDGVPGIVYEDRYAVDVFGTVWRFRVKGLGGEPYRYPLEDLDKVKEWSLPDPEAGYPIGYATPKPIIPWEELFSHFDKLREQGRLVVFSLHHFLFQKLMDVIPLNKLVPAIYKGDERFVTALEKIASYQLGLLKVAKRYKGIDVVTFLEDLGSQDSPLIRPQHLRKYFLPYYKMFFREVRDMGALIYFHSDGNIMPLSDIILEARPDIVNIQDIVNGVDNIAQKFREEVCIDLDIDREHLIPYGTKEEILNHIKNAIEKLNTSSGGLMLHIEVYPPTPLENILYLAEACYTYCYYMAT
ncbi:MAG: uroporphyrinogen decarboxylase family protein [Ignisphaera sp.]